MVWYVYKFAYIIEIVHKGESLEIRSVFSTCVGPFLGDTQGPLSEPLQHLVTTPANVVLASLSTPDIVHAARFDWPCGPGIDRIYK